MSTYSRFKTFCDNIKLTSNQRRDAQTKYDNVSKVLHNYYYPNTVYNGSTKLLIGSYGKHTAISPPGDVDVVFKIPWAKYDYFSKQKTGTRLLLNEVRDVLNNTFTTTDRITPNGMEYCSAYRCGICAQRARVFGCPSNRDLLRAP